MSCVLRVSGDDFNIENFMRITGLKPCMVFKKGEPRFKLRPRWKRFTESGANFVVSDADFEYLIKQIKDSIKFLRKYGAKLESYRNSHKDSMSLDFAVDQRDGWGQSDRFPSELLFLAGSLGIDIQLSQYPK